MYISRCSAFFILCNRVLVESNALFKTYLCSCKELLIASPSVLIVEWAAPTCKTPTFIVSLIRCNDELIFRASETAAIINFLRIIGNKCDQVVNKSMSVIAWLTAMRVSFTNREFQSQPSTFYALLIVDLYDSTQYKYSRSSSL